MDTLGCCFVGTITALGGGTVRDVLLGRLPVFWFKQTSFLTLSIATGLATFFGSESLESVGLLRSDALFIGDTLGLGAFAVVGAQAAISVGMPLPVSCVCGMLTATCGGLVRDVLCSRKNQGILYSGEGEAGALYAPTALAGAALYGTMVSAGAAQPIAILLGVGATIVMRCVAYSYRVRLPPMTRFVSTQQESAPQPSLALGDAHLFVTAYGPDKLGLVATMSACISAARANISASKIITIGEDIAFMMVVSAPSEVAETLGKALRTAGQQRGLRVETTPIHVNSEQSGGDATDAARHGHSGSGGGHSGGGGGGGGLVASTAYRYRARVELLGADSPGLVHMAATFLAAHKLNIQSMDSRVYSGGASDAHSGAASWLRRSAAAGGGGGSGVGGGDGGDGVGGGRARGRKLRSAPTETGVSRGVHHRAEGDLFCLSAVVTADEAPNLERLQAEAARLEAQHGVSLQVWPLGPTPRPHEMLDAGGPQGVVGPKL